MGVTYIQGTVTGPTGVQESVQFLVDSGAQYSLLPEAVWRKLAIVAKRTQSFRLVDGSRINRSVSECHVSLPQGEGHTPVVLGEPGDDEPLLGVVTLEALGLVLNPFNRQLQPMQMML